MMAIRALLVDDEEPARDRLKSLLGDLEGIEIVGEAQDGEEALEIVGNARPDLVFLDIQMPGLTGMEVAAALPPPRPRIIFCTAFDQYAIEAFEHHAADYLLKPVGRKRLATAIDRVRRSMTDDGRLEREVADAKEAQARLFPHILPPMTHLEFSGTCRAAREVGGDYYDFLPVAENRLGIAVGDVSGKGIFAGLVMANLQARLQSLAPVRRNAPADLMNETNRLMYAATESNRYVTLFYALFDDTTLDLRYVNAGHNPPIHVRGEGVTRLSPSGMAVGLMPDTRYDESCLRLAPGDVLVVYTDGLTEMRNPEDEEHGDERIAEVVSRHPERSSAELRDIIVEQADLFRNGMTQIDDLTVVVVKVR